MARNQAGEATDEDRMHTPSRRRILQALGSAGVIGVAGCSGGEETRTPTDDSGTPTDDSGTPTDVSELQDSVTISLGYTPNVVADLWVGLYGIMPYFTAVVEPLVWVNDEMEPEPWLATAWEATGDRTWEFTLREDVTFHNGEPFTAEAVVFSVEEIFGTFPSATAILPIGGPEGVRVIDDHTVEFTTMDSFPNFPGNIAHNMVAMQHPEAVEREEKPIGTGPFQVEERKEEQSATLSVSDNYWRDVDFSLSEVTYKVVGDANSRALSLQAHEIDIAYNLSPSQAITLRNNQETDITLQQRPQIVYVGSNVNRPPTDDARLRQALNYATDQAELVETIIEGIGVPATGPIPEIIYWSAHDDVPTYGPEGETFGRDLDRARALVDESTYEGEELEMLVNPRLTTATDIAEVLQEWWREIDVDVNIVQLEYGTYTERWAGGEAHLDVTDRGAFNGAPDILMYSLFYSEYGGLEGESEMALGPELDELIEAARQSHNRDEIIENYTAAQQMIMEEAVIVPLYYEEYIVGTRSDVSGLHTPPIMQMVKWEDLEHREI